MYWNCEMYIKFQNLILEKDAQYLSKHYYIESMLKWYYFLYIELNKATIKIKKKRSRRDLWLLFSYLSYLVISAFFFFHFCFLSTILWTPTFARFLCLFPVSSWCTSAHLTQTTLNLGPQNFKKLNLLCKKRDFSRGSPSQVFHLVKYYQYFDAIKNTLETGSGVSCIQSSQPSLGLVTWLSLSAANSEIIMLPRCHLICIWHISSFHLH